MTDSAEKAKLREGDSLRAQIYRLKDVSFEGFFEKIPQLREHGLFEEATKHIETLRVSLEKLGEDENDQAAFDSGKGAIETTVELLKDERIKS